MPVGDTVGHIDPHRISPNLAARFIDEDAARQEAETADAFGSMRWHVLEFGKAILDGLIVCRDISYADFLAFAAWDHRYEINIRIWLAFRKHDLDSHIEAMRLYQTLEENTEVIHWMTVFYHRRFQRFTQLPWFLTEEDGIDPNTVWDEAEIERLLDDSAYYLRMHAQNVRLLSPAVRRRILKFHNVLDARFWTIVDWETQYDDVTEAASLTAARNKRDRAQRTWGNVHKTVNREYGGHDYIEHGRTLVSRKRFTKRVWNKDKERWDHLEDPLDYHKIEVDHLSVTGYDRRDLDRGAFKRRGRQPERKGQMTHAQLARYRNRGNRFDLLDLADPWEHRADELDRAA